MKNKIVSFSVLAVFALFAVIAVPSVSATYPANAVYFEPEDSTGEFCENTYVRIMVNASALSTSVGMDIYFDPSCVNITAVNFTGSSYYIPGLTNWSHWGDHIRLGGMGWADPGIHLVANLTLHCENEAAECTSDLVFTEPLELLDKDGDPLPDVTWHNGTFTCEIPPGEPDLNVTEITVNYDASSLGGRAVGPEPGDGVHTQCNNISAVIEEDNGVATGAFDVTFKVDGTTLCTVRVPGLAGGANKTVYCNCSWYPYAGDAFAINVTVDSSDEILESDETNNTMWNNGIVVSNGYKGDGWQGPDKNLTNVQCHEQDTINLTYSVGDSEYLSGATNWTEYAANWTTADLPVPEYADIEKAWLYVYYTWDKADVMPDNVDLKFNDNDIPFARHYSDRKGFGGYNFPSGMLVYDVTNDFIAIGNNKAVLTKSVAATDQVSMRGMLLMVVYKHPGEPERIICIDEGYDMLYAKDSYAVSSEEATTYAPFTCCEPIPMEEIIKATLIAVAPSASDGDDKNRLSFNAGLWKGIWDHYEANTELGIAEANVFTYLKATDNLANFQSHIPAGATKGDFMDASNAFLILEKEGVEKPDLVIEEKWEQERKGKYKVYFVVKNIGTATAPKGHHATLSVDDEEIEHKLIRKALRPGETYESSFKTRVECTGDFDTIKVCADDFDFVDESDEMNNCLENEWRCEMAGEPDLVIKEKREEGRRGKYKVYFVVENIGTATAPKGHHATLSVDGEEIEHKLIRRALRPGEAYRSSFKTRVECTGDFDTIRVCADDFDFVVESDETNNCLENEWTCKKGD